MPSRWRLGVWGACVTGGLALVVGVLTVGLGAAPHAVGDSSSHAPTAAVAAKSLVATINSAGAQGSRFPSGPSVREVPGGWYGAPSVLPVIGRQPGWAEVRVAQRPNGTTTWVPDRDVSLASDPYHIVIDLDSMRLQLFYDGKVVRSFPAGVGISAAPTPTGSFFVAFLARAPSPAYGAFVIVTSAHSNTISDWEESGDAITAIHGPLGADALIGRTGARISHGCIRLHDADLAQLRDVPAGTPIDIVG